MKRTSSLTFIVVLLAILILQYQQLKEALLNARTRTTPRIWHREPIATSRSFAVLTITEMTAPSMLVVLPPALWLTASRLVLSRRTAPPLAGVTFMAPTPAS
jgi:hypothetical protein